MRHIQGKLNLINRFGICMLLAIQALYVALENSSGMIAVEKLKVVNLE